MIRGISLVFLMRIANVFFVFAISILLTRSLGLSTFGSYATYIAFLGLAAVPLTAGIPNMIIKEASPQFERGDLAPIRGLLWFIKDFFLVYFLILSIILSCIAFYYSRNGYSYSPFLAALFFVHVLFQSVSALRSAILRAAGHIVRGQLLERVILPIIQLSGIVIFAFNSKAEFSLFFAVYSVLIAQFIVFIWGAYWVKKFALDFGSKSTISKKRIINECLSLSGSSTLSSLLVHGSLLLVSSLASLEAAGVFRVASSVSQPLIYFHDSLAQVIAPKLSSMWSARSYRKLKDLLHISAFFSMLVALFGCLVLYLFGNQFIVFAYQIDGNLVLPIVLILALSHVVNVASGFTYDVLNMSGFSQIAFTVRLKVVPLTLVSALLLIMLKGVIGAAIAMLMYQTLMAFSLRRQAVKMSRIDPTIWGALISFLARKDER